MTADKPILMVDDNPDFVELARRALSKCSIKNPLVVAEDGAQALDYLFGTGKWNGRDPNEVPILIMLDLKLPKVSGLDVLRKLREDPRTRLVPVVIMTTSVEEQDVIAGYDLGTNAYIKKPVDYLMLLEVLRETGVFWLGINVPPVKGDE